ncbi:hypothetical protein EJ110_NYTH09633 [Nymphaea thermarum]|nr:hypothetical protein EJ110_NYTH09633 [Nymphaea thermarum]
MGLRARRLPSDHSKYPNVDVPRGKEVLEASSAFRASESLSSHGRNLLLRVPNSAKEVQVVISGDVIHEAWIQSFLWNNMSCPMNQWRGWRPGGRVQQWLPISVSRVGCGHQGRLDGCWAPVRMRALEQCSQSTHVRAGHGGA